MTDEAKKQQRGHAVSFRSKATQKQRERLPTYVINSACSSAGCNSPSSPRTLPQQSSSLPSSRTCPVVLGTFNTFST